MSVVECGGVWWSVVECGGAWLNVVRSITVMQYNTVILLNQHLSSYTTKSLFDY